MPAKGKYSIETYLFIVLGLIVAIYILLLPNAGHAGFVHNSTASAIQNISYIFCSGLNYITQQNSSYFAPINSSGIGKWNKTQSYPIPSTNVTTHFASCSIYSNYIYCVGTMRSNIGHSLYYQNINTSYFASITSNGIGQWQPTAPYPVPFTVAGCSSYQNYLYCIGTAGYEPNGNNDAPFALYAPINSSGIGSWSVTTPYPMPMFNAGCSIYNNYIYCVGNGHIFSSHNQTYFATINSSGIGQWQQTTPYPVSMFNAGCSISNGYIYCVGTQGTKARNQTYFATVNSSGIGKWVQTTPYPVSMFNAGCSISNGYIYCVGTQGTKARNQTYFATVNSSGIGQWQQTTPYPSQIYGQYCQIPGSGGGYLGGGGPDPLTSINSNILLANKNTTGVKSLNLSMLFRDPT